MNRACDKYKIIQAVISKSGNVLSVSKLCQTAGVSRSGYYNWIKSDELRQRSEQHDRDDFELILTAYSYRGYSKGARSIYMRLLHDGVRMNLKKIRRLMRKYGLYCPIRKANPYRRMQKAFAESNVAENIVNREFKAHGARQILLTDITYIPCRSVNFYLCTILDAYTKQILAYVLSTSLAVDFVLLTIENLILNHGIDLNTQTIIHSDQGCQYTSHKFIEILDNHRLRQSMSRRGNCWDNAPQESFFGHMKEELKQESKEWTCFEDVKLSVDDWMDYYNNDRYQWNLAKLSPNQYYEYVKTGVYPLKERSDQDDKT